MARLHEGGSLRGARWRAGIEVGGESVASTRRWPVACFNDSRMGATEPIPNLGDAGRIVVLGMGNAYCQDDGIGPLVVAELARRYASHRAAEWVDAGTVGLSLLCYVRGRAGLIVVDAANLSVEPGQLCVLEGEALDRYVASPRRRSVHEIGLSDLLGAAALSQALPEHRALVAIQPGSTALGATPTPAVSAALDAACQAVLELIARWEAKTGAASS